MAVQDPNPFQPAGLSRTLAQRLRVDEGGCWLWTGYRRRDGYGLLTVRCADGKWRPKMAHRLVYQALVGPINDETLDHLCRNKLCVNPQHLEPASRSENTRRSDNVAMLNARKLCCPKCGGEYEQRTDSKRRICRPCFQAYAREYQRDKRAAAKAVA